MNSAKPRLSITGYCFGSAALAALLTLGGCQHQSSYGTEQATTATRSVRVPSSDMTAADTARSPAEPTSTMPTSTMATSIAPVPDDAAKQPDVADVATAREINFDVLKFDHEKGAPFNRSLLTSKVEQLDGKPIRIRGFILPSFKQSGLTEFVLVRDNQQCCFGKGAALFDCIIVQMEKGTSAEYSIRAVTVEGTFKIKEWRGVEGETMAVYHLDGRSVK